jgi:hypothetical protein
VLARENVDNKKTALSFTGSNASELLVNGDFQVVILGFKDHPRGNAGVRGDGLTVPVRSSTVQVILEDRELSKPDLDHGFFS